MREKIVYPTNHLRLITVTFLETILEQTK